MLSGESTVRIDSSRPGTFLCHAHWSRICAETIDDLNDLVSQQNRRCRECNAVITECHLKTGYCSFKLRVRIYVCARIENLKRPNQMLEKVSSLFWFWALLWIWLPGSQSAHNWSTLGRMFTSRSFNNCQGHTAEGSTLEVHVFMLTLFLQMGNRNCMQP